MQLPPIKFQDPYASEMQQAVSGEMVNNAIGKEGGGREKEKRKKKEKKQREKKDVIFRRVFLFFSPCLVFSLSFLSFPHSHIDSQAPSDHACETA